MHDSQEPSYYEIALTNRQVLVFFVVLLLSVVGAFFSGVWLGQQRATELPVIAQTPVAEEAEPAQEALAELNFFTDDKPAASSKGGGGSAPARPQKTVAAAGSPDTTLLEDLNGASSKGGPSPAPAQPVPAQPTSTKPSAVAVSNSLPAPGGYVIQVFSSADGGQARKLLDRLTSGGYDAYLSPVDVKGRTMHRVRIGPFPGKSEAETMATKVGESFRLDTWVTRNE